VLHRRLIWQRHRPAAGTGEPDDTVNSALLSRLLIVWLRADSHFGLAMFERPDDVAHHFEYRAFCQCAFWVFMREDSVVIRPLQTSFDQLRLENLSVSEIACALEQQEKSHASSQQKCLDLSPPIA
jgi:hypothetical protein